MKKILDDLYQHRTLSQKEAEQILINIAEGTYNTAQISSFLTVFNMRGITIEELKGFRKALLDLCVELNFGDFPIIDMCGTGGDGKNTFNISTLASFVVAGTGEKVAKHGNYAVSSACGSSDVMQKLGLRFTKNEDRLRQQIEKANICILHAPLFHPALKKIASVRRDLAVPTFFNMLGPMINPAHPTHQLVGVYSAELGRKYQYVYQGLNKSYAIVHTLDGYDEISLTETAKLVNNKKESLISPEEMGFKTINPQKIRGGKTVKEAADIFIKILKNEGASAQRQVVIANAATALQLLRKSSFEEAKAEAEESLMSGKAFQSFNTLIHLAS